MMGTPRKIKNRIRTPSDVNTYLDTGKPGVLGVQLEFFG